MPMGRATYSTQGLASRGEGCGGSKGVPRQPRARVVSSGTDRSPCEAPSGAQHSGTWSGAAQVGKRHTSEVACGRHACVSVVKQWSG